MTGNAVLRSLTRIVFSTLVIPLTMYFRVVSDSAFRLQLRYASNSCDYVWWRILQRFQEGNQAITFRLGKCLKPLSKTILRLIDEHVCKNPTDLGLIFLAGLLTQLNPFFEILGPSSKSQTPYGFNVSGDLSFNWVRRG